MDISFHDSRFFIGIDLGTTNIALSYVDRMSDAPKKIELFQVPQLIAPGEIHEKPSLPSFYFILPEHEISHGAMNLPWRSGANHVVGYYARNHGASMPDRFISSAKSWLAHSGVDRTAPILPWGSAIKEALLSPVEVSKSYISHLKNAWNSKFETLRDSNGSPCLLEDQMIVITIPASFDEVARELTVEAAKEAGLKHITLLEEPLAAFYSWLAKSARWSDLIKEGDTTLIVDIGGGTTDFSLITMEKNGTLVRTAVGNHLLLGGDNIDIALAHLIERKWKISLGPREWGMLCQQCRMAKERLFSDDTLAEAAVSVSKGGSSIIGSTLSANLSRDELNDLIENGFYPELNADCPPSQKKGGLRGMGLPYEKDPAITRHMLSFLKFANFNDITSGAPVIPDKILFNGGSVIPEMIRNRLLKIINSWSKEKEVKELKSWNLDLAVSVGASYYALVKAGAGVKVKGGIARAYFLETMTDDLSKLICIMPRDTEEGHKRNLTSHHFTVKTNQLVKFPVKSSATRLHDKLGEIVDDRSEITDLPPLMTVIQFGKKETKTVEVELSTLLNETGTLEIWLNSLTTEHRWQLKFDMRALHYDYNADDDGTIKSEGYKKDITLTEHEIKEALKIIEKSFSDKKNLPSLVNNLENFLGIGRDNWSVSLIRRFSDYLLEIKEVRKKTPEHEARWLNFLGFCLRPGFGTSTDSWQIKQTWPLWISGPFHSNDGQVLAEWWVLWRRVAGGLMRGHQDQISGTLIKRLLVKNQKIKESQEIREMWRALGSLEMISLPQKIKIADHILNGVERLENYHSWTLGRLGARNLVYATAELVIPAAEVSAWIPLIMKKARKSDDESVLFALSHISEHSGDKARDLSEKTVLEVEEYLKVHDASSSLVKGLRKNVLSTRKEEKQLLGDSLPIGLHLSNRHVVENE